ncbi:MAG: PA2778 family cysteine peptidase [Campylobacteraceae bacterium]|nr:PA2778 family cysteine peptidase [Campylobacteraceae bacterium]
MCALFLLFAGCAQKNYDFISKNPNIKESKRIALTLFKQSDYHCGPSAIATILSNQKVEYSYDDIARKTFTPELKGTLQSEMKAVLRSYGVIPYELKGGIGAILAEASNDTPSIVLLNLGLKTVPVWHYTVITGFDKKEQKIYLSSPDGKETWMYFDEFESFLDRSGNWVIAALKPPLLPISADEDSILNAILDMYDVGEKESAKQAAIAYLSKKPSSYFGIITLANIYFSENDFKNAVFMYKEALKSNQKDAAALNNLALSLLRQNRPKEAVVYAKEAVKIGGKFLKKYQNTLLEIEEALKER